MRIIGLLPVLFLSACGPAGFGGSSDSDGPSSETESPAVRTSPAETFSADIKIVPDEGNPDQITVPEAFEVTYNPDTTMTIVGTPTEQKASQKTSGVAFVLDEDAERRIAGNKVKVSILAKSDDGANLWASYSTNDVGNSGWTMFDMTDAYEVYSFEYDVRPMNNGNLDYLGLMPMDGQQLSVAAVGVDFIAPLPAPETQPDLAPNE